MIVLVLTVGMFLYLEIFKHGYEIAVIGDSENTARYAGIRVSRVYVRTMLVSGAICGLAGFIAVSGAAHTISTTVSGGRGFTAIIVAWLAQFNSIVMVIFSFLLIVLQKGRHGHRLALRPEPGGLPDDHGYHPVLPARQRVLRQLHRAFPRKEGVQVMSSFISLFTSAIAFGTIIMFGALGEILTEKGGHLNLGVPGIMYIGPASAA